ncbi:MAG: hypothetical protein J7L12_04370 [Desulfurococcales archaeon]|nr:hypothetical protein [Desulfurococcales archaeon]
MASEDLKVVYEDEDVVVMRAPDDSELEKLVIKIIKKKGRPVTWGELRKELSGLAGEDRLRKVLVSLIERDEVIEMIDGTFGLRGMEVSYIPRRIKKRVRPLVPSKFRMRWGPIIEMRGSISAAIEYLRELKLKERLRAIKNSVN